MKSNNFLRPENVARINKIEDGTNESLDLILAIIRLQNHSKNKNIIEVSDDEKLMGKKIYEYQDGKYIYCEVTHYHPKTNKPFRVQSVFFKFDN